MRLCFFALVEKNTPHFISRISVPDLALELEGQELSGIDERGIITFLAAKILATLQQKNAAGEFIDNPKDLAAYAHLKLENHDFWVPITVNHNLKRGFFTMGLPILGKCSFVICEIFSTIISIAAMEVATADISNSNTRRFLSIGQSLIANSLGTIMYFYSQSGYTMSKLGMKIDRYLQGKPNNHRALIEQDMRQRRDCSTNTKVIAAKLGLYGFLVINCLTNTVYAYESNTALGKSAKDAGSIIPEALFDLSKWTIITLGSITTLSFVGSFIEQFKADVEGYLRAPRVVEARPLEEIRLDDDEGMRRPLLG